MATLLMQRITWRSWGLIASETALIVAAVACAAYIRLPADGMTVQHLPKALLIAGLCQTCLYYGELYDVRVLADRREIAVRLLQSLGAASILLATIYFWLPSLELGRGVFVTATLFVITGATGWRMVFEWVGERIGHRERLLLVGTGRAAVSLARELVDRKDLGVEIVGFVDPTGLEAPSASEAPARLGTLDDIPAIVAEHGVDRVVVSLGDARGRLPMDRLLEIKLRSGVRFDHLASLYEEYTGKIAVENLRPSWLIFSKGFRKSRVLQGIKRAIDICAASAGLLVAAPVLLLVAAAVRVTSPGPVLYRQKRVGHHGRVFVLQKFRSMRDDAERATGPTWSRPGDERVTAVGRLLRITRLDELPQLWNVLRGDMSLVGPRPERPEFVQALTRQIPFYGQRHVVKPGVTGWAQVRYDYGSSVEDAMEKLQYDLFYIKNMSIGLDLFIVFKTIQTVVLRRGT